MSLEHRSSSSYLSEPIMSRPRARRVSMGQNGSYREHYGSPSMTKDSQSSLREHTAGLSAMAMEEGLEYYKRKSSDNGVAAASDNRQEFMHRYNIEDVPSSVMLDEEEEEEEDFLEEDMDTGRESTPLLQQQSPTTLTASDRSRSSFRSSIHSNGSSNADGRRYQTFQSTRDVESQAGRKPPKLSTVRRWCKKNITKKNLKEQCITVPIRSLPAVLLGLLLNILDGLSYGILLFDTSRSIFSHLGPAGLSMFYVSCIVSQLVYSFGGSVFKAGVGGEMIEVVPFFHSMGVAILEEVGEGNPQSVISTTILAYALSSIVTGSIFFILGYARLGSLIGFFPRHILVGCVGGVGWFLVVTGLEVTGQRGPLEYTWTMFTKLIELETLQKWLVPLGIALFLMVIQRFNHHPLILPGYFIAVFCIFHLIVSLVPSLSLEGLRETGWIFQPPAVSEPWYGFYDLYDFGQVNYWALVKTIPAMFALTFFGILHVPINVPALAASIEEDNVDIDRELIAHGISNGLSGMLGSVQNYLVYTNSLLFIRGGADSRVAGVILAIATFCVMAAGPVIIGYIPVLVVGALIFLLGIELMQEALYDTWGRLSNFEYFTIVVIVISMGAWDFVYGILVGIMLACASFVIQASRTSAIKSTYTGAVARSTVRRHAVQRNFLKQVGEQIYVMKLSGALFFGTIVNVEKTIRNLIEQERFSNQPIRYLVLDVGSVTDIDYSASEGFARINRLLKRKGVFMLMCGVTADVSVMKGLRAIELLGDDLDDGVRLFENLNTALEWCENEFLSHYYRHRELLKKPSKPVHQIPKSHTLTLPGDGESTYSASPRATFLKRAAENTIQEDVTTVDKWEHFKQPLPIMMQIFQDFSAKNEDFWNRVAPYFVREELKAGTVLYAADCEPEGFYLVESGILRADYSLEQGKLFESILAGTTCGELPFFSETDRSATVSAEVDSVVWKLDREHWELLQKECDNGTEVANELLKVALKLTVERFTSVTAYVLISS